MGHPMSWRNDLLSIRRQGQETKTVIRLSKLCIMPSPPPSKQLCAPGMWVTAARTWQAGVQHLEAGCGSRRLTG